MNDLNAKNILVTGASGAIGAAIARRLGAAGYRLHMTSRDVSRLDPIRKELTRPGQIPFVYALDLRDSARIDTIVGEFFKSALHPFGLVCNAGDLGELGPFVDIPFSDWKVSVDKNFAAHAQMIHAFATQFIKSKQSEGSIVVLSGAGLGGPVTPNLSSYGTSKAALTYLVEALATEWSGNGLTINSIAPGQVKSDITEQALRAGKTKVGAYALSAEKCKESGGVSPDLAAQLVEFLFSGDARGITGRLLSARFDQQGLKGRAAEVTADPHLYRLRRIDRDLFGPCKEEKKS